MTRIACCQFKYLCQQTTLEYRQKNHKSDRHRSIMNIDSTSTGFFFALFLLYITRIQTFISPGFPLYFTSRQQNPIIGQIISHWWSFNQFHLTVRGRFPSFLLSFLPYVCKPGTKRPCLPTFSSAGSTLDRSKNYDLSSKTQTSLPSLSKRRPLKTCSGNGIGPREGGT